MKVAVLGGTFNPPHIGHLFLAEEVRCAFQFDRIIFIPAHSPAHKAVAEGTSAGDRLALCREAVQDNPAFLVDDCEIRRGGISYMIDTIAEIIDRYAPDGKPGLILGDDLCPGFPDWKQAPLLAARARIILVRRNTAGRVPFPFPHDYFENRIFPLSSSEIRSRIRQGKTVCYLVPPAVSSYIEAKGLYRG